MWCLFFPVSYLISDCKGSVSNGIVETGHAWGACHSHFICGLGIAVSPRALLALPFPPWGSSKGKCHERQLPVASSTS